MPTRFLEAKKSLANESQKTSKAREKLKKRLDALEKKITPEALQAKRIEIHQWIARHASHRIILKNKNISLFDENQNAANQSKGIFNILNRIQQEWINNSLPVEKKHQYTLSDKSHT